MGTIQFSPKFCTEFAVKWFSETANFCVRDKNVTTAPARHGKNLQKTLMVSLWFPFPELQILVFPKLILT